MSTTIEPQEVARPRVRTDVAQRNGRRAAPAVEAAGRSSFWRANASAELHNGGLDGNAAWKVYWKNRRPVASLAQLCDSPAPLGWSISGDALPSAGRAVYDLACTLAADANHDKFFKGKARKQLHTALETWLQSADKPTANTTAGAPFAMTSLAAAHVLAAVGAAVDADLGWRLIDCLHRLAAEALADPPPPAEIAEAFIAEQLLAGELALTLSCQFDEMKPLHGLREQAQERLSASLEEGLNRDGLPQCELIPAMRTLAACWTRCRAIGEILKAGCWSKQAERRYQKFVRQVLRWTAPDGSAVFDSESSLPLSVNFLQQSLHLAGGKKNIAAAAALFGEKSIGRALVPGTKCPALDEHCETSGLAIMRTAWSPQAAVVAVDYSAPEMKLEVWAGTRKLFSGQMEATSEIDGEQRRAAGTWDEVCWFTDKDAAYLELSLELADGARLERQILLGRRESIFLLIDHLKCADGASLRHEWRLPIGPRLLFCGEGETRDALLVDGLPVARLMPLALPEWRIDPRVGEFTGDNGVIRLSQQAAGTSMACPLLVDLCSERTTMPSTWRQLTVVELLDIQPADVAVAYRAQCGKDQWVYYRAQTTVGNRTFLGQNTSSECVIARFLPKTGEIRALVEIES
jgi:hypothetical protein